MPRTRHGGNGVVDWADLRTRMEAVGRTLSGTIEMAPEEVRERLEERARELARPKTPSQSIDRLDVVTFSLANETYAVDSRYVIEVFRLRELAVLPGARRPISGLTAWRGDLLVILDVRMVLGLPITALNDLSRVLVLGREKAAFGVLADAVHGMTALNVSDLQEPPERATAKTGYVRGMTSEAMLLLDSEPLLHLLDTDRSRRLESST